MHFKGWYYYHRQTWTKSPEWWRTSRLFFFCRRIEYGHCRERQLVIRRLRVWRFFHACNSGGRSGSTKSKAERKTKLLIMNSSKNESKRIFTRHLLIMVLVQTSVSIMLRSWMFPMMHLALLLRVVTSVWMQISVPCSRLLRTDCDYLW